MRRTVFCAIAIVLSLCPLTSPSPAGTIVQSGDFFGESEGGQTYFNYNQLSPSLAPLNDVTFTITASGGGGYILLNNSFSSQTFNVTESFNVSVVASVGTTISTLLNVTSIDSFPLTLGSGSSYDGGDTIGGTSFTVFMAMTTDLSPFVGTGQNYIAGSANVSVRVVDPSISVDYDLSTASGTATVSYYYGTTFYIPEPSSVLMLSLGLAGVAARAWRRRTAA